MTASEVAAAQSSRPVVATRRVVNGVTMLEHSAEAFIRAPQYALSPKPIAEAGGADEPRVDLTWAWYVELLADGRIVSLSSVGNHLLLFRADGALEKELSRTGNGPGELMAPSGLARARGDTLIVLDGANNRLNRVVVSRGFVSTRMMPDVPGRSSLRAVGALRGGEIVASTAGFVQSASDASRSRQSASIVLFNRTATSADAIISIPDLERRLVETRFRGRPGVITQPLRLSRRAAVVAWDTVIATGSGDGYRIDLRDMSGRVKSTLLVRIARRPVTNAIRDSIVTQALRALDGPKSERMVDPVEARRLERSAPIADSLPPYGEWFVTRGNVLWITDALAPGDQRGGATAFGQDGAIVGRLTWPNGDRAVAISDDRIVLRHTDDDGVVSLRVHRLDRAISLAPSR